MRDKIQGVNLKSTTPAEDSKPIPLEQKLALLEAIGRNPHTTQADLAAHLGVAVGTVNWYLKRMISKGYIKITHLQRRRLLYLITPRGVAEKSRLGMQYAQVSLRVYRETRRCAMDLLTQVQEAGFETVCIVGAGELAEICRLTCLERGVQVAAAKALPGLPALQVDGAHIYLRMP